jgi:hypothetical protein
MRFADFRFWHQTDMARVEVQAKSIADSQNGAMLRFEITPYLLVHPDEPF